MNEIMYELFDNGYESYIVGGYVRDYLLGIKSNDIDICTNAPINKINKIFKNRGRCFKEYFAYHIAEDDFTYDITTYRKELRYRRNKPVEIKEAEDLKIDLLRRDFTINTLAIDINGKLVDLFDARKDLNSKIIKVVGDTKKKLTEDKTRIVRALRFACTLDFELDNEIVKFIESKNKRLLNEVTKEYKKSELDKIFDSGNSKKFFYYIKRYNIEKFFNIKVGNNIKETYNRYGIYSQIEFDLPISNKEKKIISDIKYIVDKGDINFTDIKKYSDDVLFNAASILGIEEKIGIVKEVYNMHSIVDIDINFDIMFRYVNIRNFKKVYKNIEKSIINGTLINDKDEIEKYLKGL